MTTGKKAQKPKANSGKQEAMQVKAKQDEEESETTARVMLEPYLRHGIVTYDISHRMVSKLPGEPRFEDLARMIEKSAEATGKGHTAMVSGMLTAQAFRRDGDWTTLC